MSSKPIFLGRNCCTAMSLLPMARMCASVSLPHSTKTEGLDLSCCSRRTNIEEGIPLGNNIAFRDARKCIFSIAVWQSQPCASWAIGHEGHLEEPNLLLVRADTTFERKHKSGLCDSASAMCIVFTSAADLSTRRPIEHLEDLCLKHSSTIPHE